MFLVAEKGNFQIFKHLLEVKGANLNVTDKDGKTPIHCGEL